MTRSFLLFLPLLMLPWTASAGDLEFLSARDAFQRGQPERVAALAGQLQGHPLQPYVEMWMLRTRLPALPADEVRQFLDGHPGELVANRLRADWLRTLGRQQQWAAFDQEWPALIEPDVELQCYQLQSLARRDPRALGAHRDRWFAGRELPESCSPVFETMLASGVLKDADIWARGRLALQAGNLTVAKTVLDRSAGWSRKDVRLLDSAATNPEGYLAARNLALRTRAEREVALFALGRVSANAPENAAQAWHRLGNAFMADDRRFGWGVIAVAGARKHSPEALDWFRLAGDTRLDPSQLEWRARAALRAQNWEALLGTIDTMDPELRDRPVWRFWRARALRQSGREQEALPLLAALAGEHHFHAQLAAEELGPALRAPPLEHKPSEEDVRAAARNPGLVRALAWYRLGLRYEGNLEWIWAVRDLDDVPLLGAAELARREGWYERSIATADRTRRLTNMALRYPTPYAELLRARAREFDVDDAWLYGLIRQESRFNANARSSVGASGLMQLMPDTARWVARRLGLKAAQGLADDTPETNTSYGTYYLKHVLTTLDASPVLASAAYNAGPRRAQAWRADVPLEGAIYIDTIPFPETREYVRKVMANAVQYARLFGRQMETLTGRLGVVPARDGSGKGAGTALP